MPRRGHLELEEREERRRGGGGVRIRGWEKFHSHIKLWAMGIRLPDPNALDVTLIPGAACCRLYSFLFTFLIISRTI
ncbi:MAG: hypothetical protein HYW13_09685, partial [Planctomycetes bacterium]|nr:hypothetical protein [Planctomycetota bacterium]